MSTDDVTITERDDGALMVRSPGNGSSIIYPVEVAALREHFAAERMPEGARELLDEARRFASSEIGRTLPERDKHRVMPLLWGLIGYLEAAYSQKGAERG